MPIFTYYLIKYIYNKYMNKYIKYLYIYTKYMTKYINKIINLDLYKKCIIIVELHLKQ
jgi:hypothetical protein